MASLHLRKSKKTLMLVLALILVISTVVASVAVFTDRVNRTTTIQVSTFDDEGYTIKRTAPDGYFTAGETVEAVLNESNSKSESIVSRITMTVAWESPVPDVYPWGNTTLGNAVITVDGTSVPYTVNANNTISFTLPEKALAANSSDVERSLKFQIPSDLASTGKLKFSFDKIELGYASWTANYNNTDLSSLNYSVGVAWNISKKQTTAAGNPNRDVIAILTEGSASGQYGLEIIKNGSDDNTNNGQMMDWSAKNQTPWAAYTITELTIDEGVTSVGDYAFAGETGITDLDFPSTMSTIGTSAFDGIGLSGELIIPASIQKIESLAFGNLPNVTAITFEHTSGDALDLPNNTAAGKETSGAFYVPNYVKTTFDFNGNTKAEKYDWVADNRMKVGILRAELTYEDVVIGQTVDPGLVIDPDNYDEYQSIHYEVIEGDEYAEVDPDTGVVKGLAQGTATIEVTIVDANGDTVKAQGTVKILGIGITKAELAYDDVVVGQTVPAQLTLLPANHGPVQSTTYEVTKGSKYASVDPDTGIVTGLKQGTATIKVTVIDTNGEKATAEASVNVLGIGITKATLAYDDVVVGQTVPAQLTILPTNYDEYQSIKYEITAGETYASVDPDTGVVKGLAQGTATVKVTIVDTNGKTVTAEATVNVLGIGITKATLAYDDVVVGQTVPAQLTILPTNHDNYQSIKYEITAGKTYASVDPDTGVVKGLAQGTATVKVTIVDTNGKTVTTQADVNVLGIGITKATLTYNDVAVGQTVPAQLTILPTNHDNYKSIQYEVVSGNTYASVDPDTGVVKGLAPGTATVKVTIVDTNGKTVTAQGTVTVYLPVPTLAANITWFDPATKLTYEYEGSTYNYARTNIDYITIKNSYTPTGDEMVSWDASEAKNKSVMAYIVEDSEGLWELIIAGNGYGKIFANKDSSFAFSHPTAINDYWDDCFYSCTSISGLNLLDTSNVTTMRGMFANSYFGLESLDLTGFNTSKVTDMSWMFYNSYSMTSLNVSALNTSNVTDMSHMFDGCDNVESLNVTNFNTTKVEDMSHMFRGCETLTSLNVSGFDTSNVTTMECMFYACSGLTSLNVSNFDTGKVTTMNHTFATCRSLTSLTFGNTFTTENVEDMSNMFAFCESLPSVDVSGFNTSKVKDMSYMFGYMYNVSSLDLSSFDTSNVETMNSMFAFSSSYSGKTPKLAVLDLSHFETSKVTDMSYMFTDNPTLTTIYATHRFNTAAVTESDQMFYKSKNIVGGAGTVYNSSYMNVKRALVDGGASNPGYFTNNIFLAYDDVKVGETTNAQLTIKSAVFDDYTSIAYKVISGTSYASVDTSGTVKGLSAGTATVQVTLGAANGDTITAQAPVTVINPVPTLAAQQTWYTQGGTTIDKAKITSIDIVDSYDTSGKTIVGTWDASAGQIGTVTAYVESDGSGSTYKLTLAGNSYGKIFANADSSGAFRDFTALTAVNGANILDTSNTTTMRSMFNTCRKLTTLDTSNWDTSKVENMGYMFVDCRVLETVDVSDWNTGNVTDMDSMFSYCYKLNSLDVSNWNTSKVGLMSYLFNSCRELTTVAVSNWDVNNVTKTNDMFQHCVSLETLDVSKWTFSTKLTDTSGMFNCCESLKALSVGNWIMDNVVYLDTMFNECESLTTLAVNNWDVGSAQTMDYMFADCTSMTSLNVSKWDTSSATNMEKMFSYCPKLTTLAVDNWDVSSVTNMKAMFIGCSGLTTLNVSKWQTTALQYVTGEFGERRSDDMTYNWDLGMFEGCSKLSVIDISGWDMDQITNNAHMFSGCSSLKSLTVPASLKIISPEFAYNCTSLTEIIFKHGATDALSMPTAGAKTADAYTTADANGVYSDGGAFYVPSYVKTTFDFNGNTKAENYDWGTDNRMLNAPMLAASNTWFTPNNSAVKKETISSVTIADTYTPGTLVDSWPAAVDEDGDGVLDSSIMAYVEDDGRLDAEGNDAGTYKLTLAGNGSGFIYANPDSKKAFQSFSAMTTFNNASLLDTSQVVYFGGSALASGMFHGCESLKTIDVSKWNTSNAQSMITMFNMCYALESIDVSKWDTGNVTSMASMFSNCQTLKTIDVSNWDVSSVRGMNDVFAQCFALETLDVSKWDTSSATTMSALFRLCYAVKELDVSKWNTSSCQNMKNMFSGCETVTSLDVLPKAVTANGTTYTAWDTSLVTDMSSMFGGCESLITLDVSKMNTNSVNTMRQMFYNCSVLPSVNVLKKTATVNGSTYTAWDTTKVTDMGWMFRDCAAMTTIDVSTFNTAAVTDMSNMFMGCSGITTVPVSNFVTDNVTDLSGMFQDCTKLTTLDLSSWNTSKVTKIGYKSNYIGMFKNCTALTNLKVAGWNTSLVEDFSYTFNNCSALQTLDLSNWSTQSATKATFMFTDMFRLDTVTLDSGFAFLTDITSSYLPTPSATYIPGAHGVWYNNSTWDQYTPTTLAEQHSSKATYVVTRPIPTLAEQNTWFAPNNSDVTKTTITSITIAESYSPSSVVDSWPAAVDQNGDGVNDDAIMAYVENDGSGNGTYKLTLAAKNYSFFYANPDSSNAFRFKNMTKFNNAHLLNTSDVVYMGSVYNSSGMFSGCTSLTTIDVSNWDTRNVKYMNYAFQNCSALTSLDVSNWDVSKVYNMENTFYGCETLTTLAVGNWDTSTVSNMAYLFHQCYNLKTLDVSKWNTSRVTNMESMFSECKVLEVLDIATKEVTVNGETYTAWDVGSVRNMLQLFSHCYAVKELDVSNWDTSNVTDMRSLFRYCDTITKLDVSGFVTDKVTDMSQMFNGCDLLTEIDVSNFVTSKVTDMASMFSLCYALESIDVTGFNTALVTDMNNMFYGCKALTSLDLSSFDTRSITQIGTDKGLYRFAYNCPKLTKIVLSENFGQAANIPSAGPAAGMFYISSDLSTSPVSTNLAGANDAMLAYGWATDKRTVTAAASLMSLRAPNNANDVYSVDKDTEGDGNITIDPDNPSTQNPVDDVYTVNPDTTVTDDIYTVGKDTEVNGDITFEPEDPDSTSGSESPDDVPLETPDATVTDDVYTVGKETEINDDIASETETSES